MAVDLGKALFQDGRHLLNFSTDDAQVRLVVADEAEDVLKDGLGDVGGPIVLNEEAVELVGVLLARLVTVDLGVLEGLLAELAVFVLDVGEHGRLAVQVVVAAGKGDDAALVVVATNCGVSVGSQALGEEVLEDCRRDHLE